MARAELRSIFVGLAASGFLLGCVDGSGGTTTSDAPGLSASPGARKSGNREIEAPEVFQTTDSALWDGRPSLGGIWVASPEVTDPERVVMFNPATGKSVTGALFRRERDNPGPTLQISSDAAEALGILAGQPTEIKVTALRKEEVEEPAEAAAPDALAATAQDPATAEDPATEGAAPDAAATAALATAALDAADAGATAVAETADAALPDAAVVEPPKKKTWKERRAEAKAKREADKAAKAAAKAAAAAGTADGTADRTGVAPLDGVDPADSAVAAIETAPLDARAPESAPEAAPVAAPKATDAAKAPATGGTRPIQIASFSKEENAKRAVEALAKIGITAQPQKSGSATKAVWGVVANGDADLLAKIKAAGFADAYFLQ